MHLALVARMRMRAARKRCAQLAYGLACSCLAYDRNVSYTGHPGEMHKASWEPDEDLRLQFMDDVEQDPTDYILAPGYEEECSVPADVPDDRVPATAKFVNFKATGKERWTEALPCMLCCVSAVRQQCCIRASWAALHALLH